MVAVRFVWKRAPRPDAEPRGGAHPGPVRAPSFLLATCLGLTTGCVPAGFERPIATADVRSVLPASAPLTSVPHSDSDPKSSVRRRWEHWGDATLRDGDLLFMRGECLLFAGMFDFTWFSTTACDSLFSHIAIVAREGDQLVAYDTSMHGPRRWELGELTSHPGVDLIAARRPIGPAAAAVPAALQFCRETVADQVEYDLNFDPDPEQLYCSELIAAAFRQGGVDLSPAVRVQDLPGIDAINPVALRIAQRLTSLQPDSPVWSLGNDRYGFWASPLLVEVLPATPADRPPTAGISERRRS